MCQSNDSRTLLNDTAQLFLGITTGSTFPKRCSTSAPHRTSGVSTESNYAHDHLRAAYSLLMNCVNQISGHQ